MVKRLNAPWVPAVVLGLLVSSCGPKVYYERAEPPAFDFPSLAQGGIAVLGATIAEGTWDERVEHRAPLTRAFEDAVLRERKDLASLRLSELRSRIGDVPYEDLLDGWDRYAKLSAEDLAALDSLVGERCRYIALGRIEEAKVTKTEKEDSSEERTKTTLRTTRTVRISFHVYDLQTGRSAWNPTMTGSDYNEKDFEEEEAEDLLDAVVSGLVDALLGGDDPEYPEAPATGPIASKVFVKFAKELPKPST